MKNYARYSGIVFQMFATIVAGVWAGTKLDKYFETNTPWITVILSLVAVFLSIYNVYRQTK